MLQADGEPDEIGRHPRGELLLGGELLMRRSGRMDRQGLGIPHVGKVGDKFQGTKQPSTISRGVL